MSIEKTQTTVEAYLAHAKRAITLLEEGVTAAKKNPQAAYSAAGCIELLDGLYAFQANLKNLFDGICSAIREGN